jgi:pyruvate dehydrogenase E2 component (dihydrolipoamide acetyltransferase)
MPHPVLVPPLGQTVDTVTIMTWYKREGEAVREGEPLYAIETDKAVLDIEAQASGVLRHVTAAEGDEVEVLSAIAEIGAESNDVAAPAQPTGQSADVAAAPAAQPRFDGESLPQRRPGERLFASPRARRLAEAESVSLDGVAGSGPQGAVVERDVRALLERRASAEVAPAPLAPSEPVATATEATEVVVEPVSGVSAGAPLVALEVDADATAIVALRQRLLAAGADISDTALWLLLLGHALGDQPALNATVEGDLLRRWRRVHIGLVVGTDAGLTMPVVRDADQKRLAQLSREARTLVERARANALTDEDLDGATMMLADLALLGIDAATALLDEPTTAVLGVGRIVGGGRSTENTVRLSLSYDRRLVDAGRASQFLRQVAQLIEQPYRLLA